MPGYDKARFIEMAGRRDQARDPDCPASTLAELAGDPAKQVRLTVAQHPATPVEFLEALARDREYVVRYKAAGNASLPAAARAHLAEHDPHPYVRTIAAAAVAALNSRHPKTATPSGEQQPLAPAPAGTPGAPDAPLPWTLADLDRPDCPASTLLAASADPDRLVRRRVAAHPHCPVPALALLAKDSDERVRALVVAHPQAPEPVIALAATSAAPRVQQALAARRDSYGDPAWLAEHANSLLRGNAARSAGLASPHVDALLADEDPVVRARAVTSLPREDARLARAVRDTEMTVRVAAASRTHDPVHLDALARDRDAAVRAAAASASHDPVLLASLVTDASAQVRRAVACSEFATADSLAVLVQDRAPWVREQAARRWLAALGRGEGQR